MGSIKIAGIIKESIVDGPGIRMVIFTQGCKHNCKNCHNPETHDINGGYDIEIDEIISMINKNPLLDGITLSGGDPLLQIEESLELAKKVKDKKLNIILYTGYKFEDILIKLKENSILRELLNQIDVLIDGKYIEEEKDLLLKFRGSKNQRIINVKESLEKEEIIVIEF